jgi:hypothetical protein
MVIVDDFEECGSENLFVYSSEGSLLRKYRAPSLGANSQFGWIRKVDSELEVAVGYQDDNGRWTDVVGTFNPQDGSVSGLRRGY